MTKKEVMQKIKEILAKDDNFKGAKIKIIFKNKQQEKSTWGTVRYLAIS